MTKTAHRITIDASTKAVFDAITTLEGLKGWYATEVKGQPGKDGEFTLSFTKHEGPFRWTVTDFTPESEVHWQCNEGPGRAVGTKASFRLSSKGGDRTAVDLVHDGFEDTDEKIAICNTLWGGLMTHLKRYAETERPEPFFQ